MTKNTYKDKSSTIQTSSTQQRQDIRCKMKLEYNQKDLGLSSKKKYFILQSVPMSLTWRGKHLIL